MRAFSHWIIALFRVARRRRSSSPRSTRRCSSRCPSASTPRSSSSPRGCATLWWIVPLLATAGSVAGAALTFWMGVKIGEQGLERWVPRKRLKRDPRPGARERRDRARRARPDPAAVSVHAVRARRRRARSEAAHLLRHADRLPHAPLRPRSGARASSTAADPGLARLRPVPRHRVVLHRDRDRAHRPVARAGRPRHAGKETRHGSMA